MLAFVYYSYCYIYCQSTGIVVDLHYYNQVSFVSLQWKNNKKLY